MYAVSSSGRVMNTKTHKILKQRKSKKGYMTISLWVNNKAILKQVHRLVAKAFIDNPKRRKQVNHIDGDKTNNTIENLEWVTNRQNGKHEVANDLCHSKLTKEQVKDICELLMENQLTYDQIGKLYNVEGSMISSIYRKESWKRIVKDYKFPKKRDFVNKNTVRKMCRLIAKGYTDSEISEMCGTYRSYVNSLRRGKIHKSITCDEFGFGSSTMTRRFNDYP